MSASLPLGLRYGRAAVPSCCPVDPHMRDVSLGLIGLGCNVCRIQELWPDRRLQKCSFRT